MADPANKTFEDFERSTQGGGQSECPLGYGNEPQAQQQQSECPLGYGQQSECPSGPTPTQTSAEPNSEQIDPRNMMPPPNQTPSQDQPFHLSTDRQSSSIPKDGTDGTWLYPSEQMFWNAMIRKGWRWKNEDPDPEQMHSIIKIHNRNNEEAWQEVLKWEAFHANDCPEGPKLVKFGGKAKDFTLRAKLRYKLFGMPLPYDRHDWIVNRCGKHVTYVIDYYDGGDVNEDFGFSLLDVRPKMTNWSEIRKVTDWAHWQNWLQFRVNEEAVRDRAKAWLWHHSVDLGMTPISDYFASQVKLPNNYGQGPTLSLAEQIRQKAKTNQPPMGLFPEGVKKTENSS